MSVPATSGEPLAGETGTRESTLPRTVGRILPLTLLWLVAGTGLAAITTRVRDWYAMPNELLNEHRAISVAQTLSPLPVLQHRQFVASFDQLYPLLIAPMFRGGDVLVDLRNAHALNAYLMTSACIPAYLLARRVTDSQLFAYLIAALSVLMPWIFFATLLMGEVAAYPVFLWALLAFQRALVEPSRRRDALAIGAIALAFPARPQLGVLAIVLPIAVAAYEIGASGRPAGRALKGALAKHRLAGVVYAAGIVAAVGLLASGRLAGALGVYGSTVTGNLVPHGIPKSLAWHLACFSLGVGILLWSPGSRGSWRGSSGRRAGRSNTRSGSANASTTWGSVSVCVPAHGYADVILRTPAREVIPGDLRTWADSSGSRIGGLFLSQISLADEIGGSCRPR